MFRPNGANDSNTLMAIGTCLSRFEEILRERAAPLILNLRTRHSRAILLVFLTLFLVGLYVSISTSGLSISDLRIVPLVAVFLGAFATSVFNAWGLRLVATYSSVQLTFRESLFVSSLGSLTNLLPIPGSVLVRSGALIARGASIKTSTVGIAFGALLWIGLAGLLTGIALVVQKWALGWPVMALCGVVSAFAYQGVRRQASMHLANQFVLQRVAMLLVMVVRFWFAFKAIGAAASLIESATFAVAGVFGAIVAIVPAGLAVSEAMAAALASLTVILPATAFVMVALNRVVGLLMNGAVCLVLHSGGFRKQDVRGA